MNVYFVYDGDAESDEDSIWNVKLFSTREGAQEQLMKIIALRTEQWVKYQDKIQDDWKKKHDAFLLIRKSGLPIPVELAWTTTTPPERRQFTHRLEIDDVEVFE